MRDAWLPPLLAALTMSPGLAQTQASVLTPTGRTASAAEAPEASVSAHVVTLPQAIDAALRDRPELAAARSEIEATEGALEQAGALPNPTFEAELEDVRQRTRTTTYLLSQPFEIGGQRGARQSAAQHALHRAWSQLAERRQHVRAEVTSAFFSALCAQERVQLADAAVDLARRGADAARLRVAAGKAAPIEETRARVAESTLRTEALQARSAWRASLQALEWATGSTRAIDRVQGDLSLPSVPSLQTLQQRLEGAQAVRQARIEVDRLGAMAQLERSKRLPDLTVGLGTRRSEETGRSQTMLTLSIPLPVFNRNQGAEVEALRRQDRARHELTAVQFRLRADVVAAHARLESAVAEAALLEHDVLPGARLSYDTSSRGFELGKFGLLEVLDSQRTWLQARAQHLKAVAEAHLAAADLERWLGTNETAGEPATGAASEPATEPTASAGSTARNPATPF
ncbi:TolC family protein [Ideonella sp. DXS29W]|uniref:TolC family protein n=1 Tax=Ideonella lacteola TaxID=2984193 RepID=A0ABU9BYF8_9BURK